MNKWVWIYSNLFDAKTVGVVGRQGSGGGNKMDGVEICYSILFNMNKLEDDIYFIFSFSSV